jgi:NADPH2:quinone reductase
MRAWIVTGPGEPGDVLRTAEVAEPEPGPGELLVEVEAAGVGLPDVLMCRGSYPLTPGGVFVAGQEVVGRVVAVGPETPPLDGLGAGDRILGVTAFYRGAGGFAERTIVPARSAWPAPATLGTAEAAGFVIPYHTAWVGLVERGGLQAGDRVLVLGAGGGSGAAAVDLAAALGATVVAAAAGGGDGAKGRLCHALGAAHVVDSDPDTLPGAVHAAFGDTEGVDLVYDPVGAEWADAALRCTARGGQLLAVGFAGGRWADPDPGRLVRANHALVGVYTGGYDRAELTTAHEAMLDLRAEGRLTPQASLREGFDALPGVLAEVADRRAVGKLAWRP